MSPKILYITDSESLGGAEVYLRALIEYACEHDFRVSLLLPERTATRSLVEAVQARAASVLTAELAHQPGLNPKLVIKGWRMLRNLRPDIVHFNLPTPRASAELMLAAALAGVPRRIATFQLVTAVPPFGRLAGWARQLNRRLHYRSLHRAIAVSEANRQLLIKEYGLLPERLICIPNGVDTRSFSPDYPPGQLRSQLNIPVETPLLAFAARLVVSKGADLLLKAMPTIWQSSPGVQLALAGSGNMQSALHNQAAALERPEQIHFLGTLDDVRPLLADCDIFMQPSLAEGLPFAVLEAMAMGRPVVASDAGGTAEAVLHSQTGLIVAPGATQPLAEAVLKLLVDQELRQRMGQAARARVVAHFSLDQILERSFALYK